MRITFPYGDIPPVDVPDSNLIGYFYPRRVPNVPPLEETVARALANPIGAPRLAESVRPGMRVLILVDDMTRPTPQSMLLPLAIDELHRGGVQGDHIDIMVCCGTHRPMTPLEKRHKLGTEIVNRYQILDHDCRAADQMVDRGQTKQGFPVKVNRRLAEADFVMSVGHIVPHRAQGFTGGTKMVLPGASDVSCIDAMHWAEAQYPGDQILGVQDNPVRQISNDFGRLAGLKYILNVVLDDEGRVVGAWAGDPVAAHTPGCAKSLEVYGVPIPSLADICIADSYPADVDLWQANKAIFAMEPAVKQGGVAILVTPSPEGVSRVHPRLVSIGYQPHQEVERLVKEGKLRADASAAALADVGRVIKDRATGIMVSPGIKPDAQRKLGFKHAATPQEALKLAFDMKGKDAKVLVFHHGGELVPLVGGHVGKAGG